MTPGKSLSSTYVINSFAEPFQRRLSIHKSNVYIQSLLHLPGILLPFRVRRRRLHPSYKFPSAFSKNNTYAKITSNTQKGITYLEVG